MDQVLGTDNHSVVITIGKGLMDQLDSMSGYLHEINSSMD